MEDIPSHSLKTNLEYNHYLYLHSHNIEYFNKRADQLQLN